MSNSILHSRSNLVTSCVLENHNITVVRFVRPILSSNWQVQVTVKPWSENLFCNSNKKWKLFYHNKVKIVKKMDFIIVLILMEIGVQIVWVLKFCKRLGLHSRGTHGKTKRRIR